MQAVTFAHTPDADDAFMWFALSANKLALTDTKIEHVLRSIQELNGAAKEGKYEISAISFGAYPEIADKYALLPCGGCLGFGTGPMLLSAKPMTPEQLLESTVAIPGKMTTAYLVLKLFEPRLNVIEVPFDQIVLKVQDGSVGAGLIIHEAQMTYEKLGLHKIVDLGEWWQEQTGLPLPLGGNIIRKDLPEKLKSDLAKLMKEAISYSLSHRPEALNFAMQWARGIEENQADKFIGLYVNDSTVDYGAVGRKAIETLYNRAHEAAILANPVHLEFIES